MIPSSLIVMTCLASAIEQSQVILQPAGDTVEHDSFGTATAISGATMVVGGVNADGNQVGAGAAFVFQRIGKQWVQTARLFAADGTAEPVLLFPGKFRSDSFGSAVAVSGDTIVVGAPGHGHPGLAGDSGAVYVFERTNGQWVQRAELFSPTPNNQDEFGASNGFGGIAVSGDTIAVTDQGRSIFLPGAVDLFQRVNGTWIFAGQLSVPADPFFLPSALAFDGRTLVVGSSLSDAPAALSAGVAYLFRRGDDGRWSQPLTLAAADATTGAQLGSSVGLAGDLVAVGAVTGSGATSQSGAAYLFARQGDSGWSQIAKLTASDGADQDSFGFSIATDRHAVLVGAPSAESAYLFQPVDDGGWRQTAKLFASDGISGGDFGTAVAVLNGTLLVGADQQHPLVEGYPGGEAYIYQLDP
jgi:hypothetical protein